jgi:hypothetical protein
MAAAPETGRGGLVQELLLNASDRMKQLLALRLCSCRPLKAASLADAHVRSWQQYCQLLVLLRLEVHSIGGHHTLGSKQLGVMY